MDLNTRSGSIDEEGNFEVVLSITVTAKMDEETGFLIEVPQAGVFLVRGFQPDELKRILGTAAPNVLFPYAREAIDAFCIKGGFPPLMLAPVNFEAVYQQAQAQAQAGAGETASH